MAMGTAGLLDSKAHIHRGLEFKKGRDPIICYICRNPLLGYHCWHFASIWNLLEALTIPYLIREII